MYLPHYQIHGQRIYMCSYRLQFLKYESFLLLLSNDLFKLSAKEPEITDRSFN
ncbi:hypothetical protein AAKU52_003349 [Pedobacter sp. CG_S7]